MEQATTRKQSNGHGGVRPGSGRKKGVPNKVGLTAREEAAKYAAEAMRETAKLAGLIEGEAGAVSEPARLAALTTIMDRAWGKPSTVIAGDADAPVKQIMEVSWIVTGAPRDGDD